MNNQVKNSSAEFLAHTFLRSSSYRTYNVEVSKRLGSIQYAIILSDLIDQYFYLQSLGRLVFHPEFGDNLFYYTENTAWERCAIERKMLMNAVRYLDKLGLIKVVKFGLPCKRYFIINFEKIAQFINSNDSYGPNGELQDFPNTGNSNSSDEEIVITNSSINDKKAFPKPSKNHNFSINSYANPKQKNPTSRKELATSKTALLNIQNGMRYDPNNNPNKEPKQQQAAVVFSDSLEKLELSEKDKQWLRKNRSKDDIDHAVAYISHPGTKISTTLVQTLRWASKERPALPKCEIDICKENRLFAQTYSGFKTRYFSCEVLSKGIELYQPAAANAKVFWLPYNDKAFKPKLLQEIKRITDKEGKI